MTMPSERTRSIMQTRDFLRELMSSEDTPGVPAEVRRQAMRLLRHFPGTSELNLAALALPRLFARVETVDLDFHKGSAREGSIESPGADAEQNGGNRP